MLHPSEPDRARRHHARCPSTLIAVLLCVVGAAMTGGCSTYINIPAQAGDVARNDPNLATVREVQLAALKGMLAEDPFETNYQVILPARTSAAHYNVLMGQLEDERAMWSIKGPRDGVAHVVIRQVRVRGWYAQTDIVRPASFRQIDGPRQLATVWLQWYPISGWTYRRTHLWSIGVEEALREAKRQAELNMQP